MIRLIFSAILLSLSMAMPVNVMANPQKRHVPHHAGDFIAETPEANIYFNQWYTTYPSRSCGMRPTLSIIFKSHLIDSFELDEEKLRQFMVDIAWPAAKSVCPQARDGVFTAEVFLEGVHLDSLGNEVSASIIRSGGFEKPFGQIRVDTRYSPPATASLSMFEHAEHGNVSNSAELKTISGLRALRDRNWVPQEKFASDQALSNEQKSLLGIELSDETVWLMAKGEGASNYYWSKENSAGRSNTWTAAQAYGRAAIEVCRDRIPGGVSVITFSWENSSNIAAEITIPSELGQAAYNKITGPPSGALVIHAFEPEALKGPIRTDFERVLRAQGCLSPIHKEIHSTLVMLAERHQLI